MVATVIESAEGCYEAQDVEFGTVYRWRPECVILECDCGERLTLTPSMTACRCGADHAGVFLEKLAPRRPSDEHLHPWRYARDREGIELPY